MSTPPASPRALSKTAPTPSPNKRAQSSTSGFPFPSSLDSPRRPGSSRAGGSTANLRARRGSNASSVLSLDSKRGGGGADATIAEASSNAISVLLQPPIIRTGLLPHTHAPSGVRPPSTRDIPPVTLTNIPHVDPSVFSSYIKQAGSLYHALRQAREEQGEAARGGDRRHSVGRRNSQADESGTPTQVQFHGMQRRPSVAAPGGEAAPATPLSPGTPAGLPLLSRQPRDAPASPTIRRRGSSDGATKRRPGLTVAPLSTIPNIYFEDDFHLENPRTFDVVSERSEIVRQPTTNGSNGTELAPPTPGRGRKALAANAILQEKMSWYMDTVEIHLISSISTASTSFFDALKQLRELHADAEASVQQIKVLREDLAKLDENMAVGGLEVVALKRKRDNLQKLGDAVRQLEVVMDRFAYCEKQIEGGEIGGALDALADLEKLIAGDEAGRQVGGANPFRGAMIDLRGLAALETAADDIAYLRKRIGTTLEANFIATLLGDLRQHVRKVPANETFKRWDSASSRRRGGQPRTPGIPSSSAPAFMEIDPQFRSDLLSQLKGLAKAETIVQATLTYREAVQKEFKSIIRRHIPSSSDDDAESTTSVATTVSRTPRNSDKSAILARNLRALDPEDAEAMFRNIYSNIGEALRRLSIQLKVLLDITSSLGGPPSGLKSPPIKSPTLSPRLGSISDRMNDDVSDVPPIPQEEMQQVLDLSSLLGQVVDIAQNQITKLLKVRSDQSTHLEVPFFLRYFTLNRLFADECEAVSGRSGMSLKTAVHDHIKSFVQIAGDNEKQALVRKMDADVWDARDFGPEENAQLQTITDASTQDNEEWSRATLIWSEETSNVPPEAKVNGLGIGIPSIVEPAGTASKQNGIQNGSDTASAPVSRPISPLGAIQTSDAQTPERSTTPLVEGQKAAKPAIRAAVLDEQSFLLPSSAIAAMSGLIRYLQLVTCIPSLAPDIAISLLDYVRIFNSRSQQLVLGAGATRSAGLRNITTKHLALSSQGLSFVAALVPYVRECVRRYLPATGAGAGGSGGGGGVLADFDKTKRSLQEHQAGIVDKFVDIMNGRAVAHVVSFKQVGWEKADPGAVGAYMETLAKETVQLHKTLARYLPEPTVAAVMVQVMASYRDVWGKAFDIVEVRSQGAKDRLKRDAEFFKARIGGLQSANDIGDYIVKIVDDKKIIQPERPAAVSRSATSQTLFDAGDEENEDAQNGETQEKQDERTT